ncbi:reverse transcriptase domain-containing protein [Tanacetum coccineum]
MTVVKNEKDELIPQRTVIGWRVCIDYRIFHELIEDRMEEKCHFMVKEGIVLGHKVLGFGIKVDKAKIEAISKLPYPMNVKDIQSFLGHAGFYRRFIKDFSQIARQVTQLLVKDAPFNFSEECIQAFDTLKRELTHAPIMINPDWSLPFEIMCDASDYVVGALTRAEIRDLFPKERLIAISDKNGEPWISPSYSNSVLTESYEDAWPEKRQHKFFDNVIADHPEEIMTSSPPQEKSSRPGFTGYIPFAMQTSWCRLYLMRRSLEVLRKFHWTILR